MTVILLRTVIFYVILTALMRLMGKRQIGELQLPEFVSAVMISEMASLPITDRDIPLLHGLIPLLTLGALEVVTAFVCKKLPKLRKLVYGEPIVLAENGELCAAGLEKARISADEVLAAMRVAGCASPDDVDCVILEQTGQISVLLKRSASPLTTRDAGVNAPENGAELPVMTDGVLNVHFAELRGISASRAAKECDSRRVKAKECLYMTVDRAGKMKIKQKETQKR